MFSTEVIKKALFYLSVSCLPVCFLEAQGSSRIPSSAESGSSSIQSMSTPLPRSSEELAPKPPVQEQKPIYQKKLPPPLGPQTLAYFHPGIIVFKDGSWQGSDHLLNISNVIGLYVEILRAPGDKLELSQEQVRSRVDKIFAQAGISTASVGNMDQPPLPAFQIKIFLYPIERGYAAYCEGRLFESVYLKRFNLDPGMAFQAITWERETLIVSPTDKTLEYLDKQIEEIANSFVELYHIFEWRKKAATR